MPWLDEMWRRLIALFHYRELDRDLEEEMRFHLEMKAAQHREAGMSHDHARHAARRRFGNAVLWKEESRSAWGWGSVERFWQDLQYAIRMLRKDIAFTAVALLTFAIAIGANTVIFTVVHGVLLAPLPYNDPARLVRVLGKKPHWGSGMSAPDVDGLRAQNTVFDGVACSGFNQADISSPGEPERVTGRRGSANLFQVLGASPLLGRGLQTTDDLPGAPPVIVLSYAMWQRRFAGNPGALGQTLVLGKIARTVVGVMPRWFQYPDDRTQFWIPLGDVPLAKNRGSHIFDVVARLKPGATLEQARTEVKMIAARLETAFPRTNSGWSAGAVLLTDQVVGGVRAALLILFGAVAMVLLIACANVANLLLSRGAQRAPEMAVRAALGASRQRLVRLLFTESLLLAALGSGLGLLLAIWGVRALTPLYPPAMPRVAGIRIDSAVLAFNIFVAFVSAVLSGLIPALRTSRTDLNAALKSATRSQGLRSGRSRPALVIAQVAMAMVLLACAGLLVRSFLLRTHVAGFQPDNILIVELPELPEGRLAVLLDRIRALPGVTSAASTTSFSYVKMMGIDVKVAGRPNEPAISGSAEIVTSDYFRTLGIALLKGRTIEKRDMIANRPVMVINETLARRYFPDRDPLGQELVLASKPNETLVPIVGVVGDVPMFSYDRQADPAMYLPFQTSGLASNFQPDTVAIRTSVRPERLANTVRSAIHAFEPKAPIIRIETMRDDLSSMVASPRFYTLLLEMFAGFALLLAGLGVYGVMSFAVSVRTHEIGVRMALGAPRRTVLRTVMWQGVKLAAIGTAIGMIGAIGATRLLTGARLLFRVKPTDPLTFALLPVILLACALAASWFPSHRAANVDPATALRHE